METLLQTIGVPGLSAIFVMAILLTIFAFRLIFRHYRRVIVADTTHTHYGHTHYGTKKYDEVNVRSYRPFINNVSLLLSMALIVAVMEFPSSPDNSLVELSAVRADDYEEMQDIPPTEQPPPPPPAQITQPDLIVVADEEEIEQEIEIVLDVEFEEDAVVEQVETGIEDTAPIEIEEELVEEIFHIVEEPAEPIGGYAEFYKFVGEHLKYPSKAMQLNVQGKVYVQFVVNKDGSLTDFNVVRGIGSGCDKEAVRVLNDSPKWKPGKQRGRAVKQYMVIPIHFKLIDH
jgi:protein TonB